MIQKFLKKRKRKKLLSSNENSCSFTGQISIKLNRLENSCFQKIQVCWSCFATFLIHQCPVLLNDTSFSYYCCFSPRSVIHVMTYPEWPTHVCTLMCFFRFCGMSSKHGDENVNNQINKCLKNLKLLSVPIYIVYCKGTL